MDNEKVLNEYLSIPSHYHDAIMALTDEDAGQAFKALIHYAATGEKPGDDASFAVRTAYLFLHGYVDGDLIDYEKEADIWFDVLYGDDEEGEEQ